MRIYIYSIKDDTYLGKGIALCRRRKKSIEKAIHRVEKRFIFRHRQYTLKDIYSTTAKQIDTTPYIPYVYIAVKQR